MARALELKRTLTNIRKSDSQSMDAYLREIKNLADNLAAVNSPVPSDLVHYTLLGLGREYETLVTTLTHVPMHLTFDDLRPRLLLQEQRLKAFKDSDDNPISHPALAVHSTPGSTSSSTGTTSQRSHQGHHNNRGRGGAIITGATTPIGMEGVGVAGITTLLSRPLLPHLGACP